jgi:hypothetical protein
MTISIIIPLTSAPPLPTYTTAGNEPIQFMPESEIAIARELTKP